MLLRSGAVRETLVTSVLIDPYKIDINCRGVLGSTHRRLEAGVFYRNEYALADDLRFLYQTSLRRICGEKNEQQMKRVRKLEYVGVYLAILGQRHENSPKIADRMIWEEI